ncbi:MAG TPA: pantoate--beta-alanine ligase [Alteromonas sp.]|jgi:pantoate--beta-alanine ligase|nr:pantoate--beta-alanine ligase [Alteromonas sp.]HCL13555.1 pantoate--beta-alanine ligase [Alteromonas sp.]HCV17215.1 pantoate--beta-alanine ligase [Alteromonas sp.]|tara:strand:- start:13762 stop:14619 length:858 start_codon:yes stop_codon:yes gene_type:complete
MQFIESLNTLRELRQSWRSAGHTVAFVPTMGNLHDGHLDLVKQAKVLADKVVVSIFVNPMQFGANEDLDAYPRTLDADRGKLEAHGVDALFFPAVDDVFPRGLSEQTFVEVPGISDLLCGASRPGHFRGVATIVCKLFNMVQPDVACFGEKDFQQLQVIRTMVEDLSMPINIVGVPTRRQEDGLAMSSRNGYLSAEQRTTATQIYAAMEQMRAAICARQDSYADIERKASQSLMAAGLKPEYVTIRNARNLQPAEPGDYQLVILMAAFMGTTRLIDNMQITLDQA